MRLTVNWNGRFFICLMLSFSAIYSCKHPDNIGLNVLPKSDIGLHNYTDTVSLLTSIVREDSVLAVGNSSNLLGDIHDNIFGESNASFYSQLLLSSFNVSFGTAPVCDSIILSLKYSGYYGDTSSTHNFEVYRMNESILTDSFYYSNRSFATSDFLGAFTTSQLHLNDSVLINGVKTAPQLQLPLNNSIASIFFNPGSSNVYESNSTFQAYFKGIYVKDVSVPTTGSILYFDLKDTLSKLTLYYNDSLSYSFYLNGSGKVNHFTHDYSSAVFANKFNDPSQAENVSYVQSMAGIKTKIDFPYLQNLVQNGNISINLAQLVVTIDNATISSYAAHRNLFLVGIDSTGKSYFLPDFISSATTFGGIQNNGSYTFLVTRYFQQVLSGNRKNYGMYLVASGASINANRTVVGGSKNAAIKTKLILHYTNLNP